MNSTHQAQQAKQDTIYRGDLKDAHRTATRDVPVENSTVTKSVPVATQALIDNKLPTTAQTNEILKKVEVGIAEIKPQGMSNTGTQVLKDTDALVETTRKILINKNPHNDLQDLLYHARLATEASANAAPQVQGQAKDAAQNVKSEIQELVDLVVLFVQSTEFRAGLGDMKDVFSQLVQYVISLGQDVYETAAPHVQDGAQQIKNNTVKGEAKDVDFHAENIDSGIHSRQMSHDQLSGQASTGQTGQGQTTFGQSSYGQGANAYGQSSSDPLIVSSTITEGAITQDSLDNVPQESLNTIPGTYQEDSLNTVPAIYKTQTTTVQAPATSYATEGINDQSYNNANEDYESSQQTNEHTSGASAFANAAANRLKSAAKESYQSKDPQVAKNNFNNVAQDLKSALPPRDEVVEKGRNVAGTTQNVVQEKAQILKQDLAPKLDELIEQLKLTLIRLQKRDGFIRAVDQMFDLLEEVTTRLQTLVQDTTASVQTQSGASRHMQIVRQKAVAVIENFSGYSLETLLWNLNEMKNVVRSDDTPFQWIDQIQAMLQHMLKDPEYVNNETFKDDAREMFESAQTYVQQYPDYLRDIMSELTGLFNSIATDRLLRDYASDWNDLMVHMFLDANGVPVLKPELIGDIPKLVRAITERIAVIPIGTIQGSSQDPETNGVDFVVENLNVAAHGLVPDDIRVRTDTKIGVRAGSTYHHIELEYTVPKVICKDICFTYQKQTFPKIHDSGMLDMSLAEISCKIQLTFLPWTDDKKKDQEIYRIDQVYYSVNDVNYHIDEARHSTLYKMLSPVIKGQVKKQVKDQLEDKTRTLLEQFQLQLVNLKTRALLMYEDRVKAGSLQSENDLLVADTTRHPWQSDRFNVDTVESRGNKPVRSMNY